MRAALRRSTIPPASDAIRAAIVNGVTPLVTVQPGELSCSPQTALADFAKTSPH